MTSPYAGCRNPMDVLGVIAKEVSGERGSENSPVSSVPSASAPSGASQAWLIEAAESEVSRPLYWRGSFGDERDRWTDDHMRAVRLSRRQDAEAVADGVLHGYAVRICEHGWAEG